MKYTALLAAALGLGLAACADSPADPPDIVPPLLTVIGGDNPEGAIVLNKGEASEPVTGWCLFAGRLTEDVTVVRNPSGGGLLSCHWQDFDFAVNQAFTAHGFGCSLDYFGFSFTSKSHFVLAPSGVANMQCTFDEVLF